MIFNIQNGSTALVLAAACGHELLVEYLVDELRARVDVKDNVRTMRLCIMHAIMLFVVTVSVQSKLFQIYASILP